MPCENLPPSRVDGKADLCPQQAQTGVPASCASQNADDRTIRPSNMTHSPIAPPQVKPTLSIAVRQPLHQQRRQRPQQPALRHIRRGLKLRRRLRQHPHRRHQPLLQPRRRTAQRRRLIQCPPLALCAGYNRDRQVFFARAHKRPARIAL